MLCITNQINLLNKLNEMNKQMTLNLNMIFNQSYSKLNKELIQINSSSSFAGSNEFVMNLLYMKTQLEQVKQSLHFNESSSVIIGKIIQSITDKHTNEKLICSNKESLINRVCNQSVGNNSVINSDTMVKHLNINKQNTLSNYLDNILDIFVEYPKVNIGCYTSTARLKKIIMYKIKKISKRTKLPVLRRFLGRSLIAKKKLRLKGKFIKTEFTVKKKIFTVRK